MGVYINMEMPKDCLKCPFCLFADGYWKCLVDGSHADFGGTCRPSLCPLIPVPPHGDLIEKNVIEKAIEDSCAECEKMCLEFDGLCADCDNCALSLVKKALTDALTIIPAEPGEEEKI